MAPASWSERSKPFPLPAVRGPRIWARDLSISLGGYLAGLSIIVLARVFATGVFLFVARVPFVVPLTLLAGASVLIPYLGSVLRLLSIGGVAWATGGPGGAVAALAFVAAYDVVENYVLSPIVYRRTLGISALGQLTAVLFLGYHFGVVGAILAIPAAATAQIVFRACRSLASAPMSAAAGAVAAQDPGSTANTLTPHGDKSRQSPSDASSETGASGTTPANR